MQIARFLLGYSVCADACATSRTFERRNAEGQAVKDLFDVAKSPESERLFALFMDGYERARLGKADRQSNQAAA
jgi:hypothetical protein